ncbi:MAG: nucleotidyltransferase substrate binding protein [Spirochaetales bacterium]|nr:nucleotidyltransferase substrate binding protein [Spirochaetales bacterium]
MPLNTDHLEKVLNTLERSLNALGQVNAADNELDYDMYRYSAVKSFELAMETSAKLLRKTIEPWMASKKAAWALTYKDLFRQAIRHGLLEPEDGEKWFAYRDNRNNTAHDYGEHFAEDSLALLHGFIKDARKLIQVIQNA